MRILIPVLFLLSFNAFASDSVVEEQIYNFYKSGLHKNSEKNRAIVPITPYEQKLYVDSIEDSLVEKTISPELLSNISSVTFKLVEKFRIELIKLQYKESSSIDAEVIAELISELQKPEVEIRLIYIIAVHEKIILEAGSPEIIELAKKNENYRQMDRAYETESELLAEMITDLYFNTPDVTNYMDGEYLKSVRIFMFCRQNRLYPCLMVMKDSYGQPVRGEDGKLWSNGALASAVTGLPSYERNGNTPAGIFTIDSVMPTADQQLSYGKFRRMMLNFVPKSNQEVLLKSLIPKSSWDNDWWSASTVARDIGRNLFRIHGSGRMNTDPNTPYFPYNRTHGCIAQRENTYNGITYKDQRNLLDSIMKAMELTPKYENEPKIKGILYIVEIEDKSEAVSLADLKSFGIE